MKRVVPLLIILYWLSATAVARAQENSQLAPALGLNRLAARIAEHPLPVRTDLARIALEALAGAYAEEALRARQDARRRPDRRPPSRWAVAVDALSQEYATLATGISERTPVEIITGTDQTLYLVIDRRWVAVSTPRLNEQALMERHITQEFCGIYRCEDFVGPLPGSLRGDSSPPLTQWSFSEHSGPVCINPDGLEIQFRTMRNLGEKRAACTRLITELHLLAEALAQQQHDGVRVEWNDLAIGILPDAGRHIVTLNRDGDSLALPLPLLATHRELFAIARPWLAARAAGNRYPLVVLNAGHLLGIDELPDETAPGMPAAGSSKGPAP